MSNLVFRTILVLLVILPFKSNADIGSTYGFGSSTAALAGANRTLAYDGFALDRSPSLMSFMPTVNSYGIIGAKDFFQDIGRVQTDNFFYGGSSQSASVDPDVPDTFNFLFGSIWALGKSDRNYRLGITFSAPLDKVTEPSSKDAYQPQYSGYASDTQRLSVSAGFSGMLNEQLSLGVALNYYLVEGATYQARMPTDTGTGRTSTSNLKMTVKPTIAPAGGLTWSDKTSFLTLYYAAPRDHKVKMKSDVLIGIIGSTPVRIDSEASLFYDPETISLGYAHSDSTFDFMASADVERWSRYDGGYIKSEYNMASFHQYPITMSFKDILIGKLGMSLKDGARAWRMGLAYRPSPHSDLENQTNYIEPDRWVLGLGHGFPSTVWGLFDEKIQVEFHAQGHYLVPKEYTKNDSTYIGGPGYKVGGYVFSYGINLSVGI